MITLSNDGVMALAARLGVQTLPLVLAIGPQQDSYRELARAQEQARAELRSGRVIDAYGDAQPETAAELFVLAQPDHELAVRVYTSNGQIRICVAQRDGQHVVAVRRGDSIEIRSIWADGTGESLAGPILEALGPCPPAAVANFSAPAQEIREKLDAATSSADYTNVIYALGLPETDATAYGLALASCHSYAEVVAYAHADGVTDRSPAAVVIYDTARGRIVAAPGVASDQQVWSTFTPGTDHRVAQAISALVGIVPGGRWMPDYHASDHTV
ncbi:ESX secretion-associated protein EspG [Nocardia yamanashiensis]|uniref:ESX secretion-associated protein EspG n=1 Tax=Nocardia yamanashiensis TaxID=209247 RepID=UPI001E470F02|nr:ESX secretion-associated protein EspG [Nocardia yamanashiensis]UGT39664.1 ESX secretion-associated protein EspG [Nocardia yamanashiensis]